MADTALSIRIDLPGGRFGPGKAELLRAISEQGSIAEAARQLGMSYARAWSLTEQMNRCFREPLVATFAGGNRRGGAKLTATGVEVLGLYESVVARSHRQFRTALNRLNDMAAETGR